jgi:hypothetical protein
MTNRFMMTVAAAALIAGTGFAYAQGTGPSQGGSSGPAAQQSAPSSDRGNSAAPMNRDAEPTKPSSGMKATQSDDKAGAKNQRAQDDMKAGAKGEKSAQDNMKGEKSKSMSSDMKDKGGAGKDMKAEGRNGNMNAEQKGAADSKSQTTQSGTTTQSGSSIQSQTTTGQVGAGAKLSTEQRTKISTVIREQRVQPVTNVNFEIRPGIRVPRTVSFRPLPREVVTIHPQWRGYDFFLVNNQIVVVNPRTLEIVDIIDV